MNCQPLGQYLGDEDDVRALRSIDLMTGYMAPSNEALIHSTTEPKDELRKGHRHTEKLASDWWKR